MKVERVSYDVMTPSAARGVLDAILWKPAIVWRILRIDVLNPIRWESVRRNEVGAVCSVDLAATAMKRKKGNLGLFIEEERQQRAGLFLRDVAYIIHACFELTPKAGHEDTITKFQEMFARRAEKGQCFHRPYLGCREFAASFTLISEDVQLPEPITETRDLGWMLHDLDFGGKDPLPCFFRAALENGRMMVPPFNGEGVRA
jgi:CRISPR-associated protein Cas5d